MRTRPKLTAEVCQNPTVLDDGAPSSDAHMKGSQSGSRSAPRRPAKSKRCGDWMPSETCTTASARNWGWTSGPGGYGHGPSNLHKLCPWSSMLHPQQLASRGSPCRAHGGEKVGNSLSTFLAAGRPCRPTFVKFDEGQRADPGSPTIIPSPRTDLLHLRCVALRDLRQSTQQRKELASTALQRIW